MEVKIDTKEKFTVVMPVEPHLYDTMTAELAAVCSQYRQNTVKNVVLNLQSVTAIGENAAAAIVQLQQDFYEDNASFVICGMKPALEDIFDKLELLELLNSTPTETEAWDIVQMEEIERELMDGDDVEFAVNE